MVIVRAVHPEPDAVRSLLQRDLAGLRPGEEAQVGLAVGGDVGRVQPPVDVDRRPGPVVEPVRELRLDGVGTHPQLVIAGRGAANRYEASPGWSSKLLIRSPPESWSCLT